MVLNKNRGDIITVQFSVKNTGSSAASFDIAFEFDTQTDGHYDKWFKRVDSPTINPGETKTYANTITVPSDAPYAHYFSIGVFVYPAGTFNPSSPQSNMYDSDSEYDIIYVPTTGAEIEIISIS